MNEYAWKYIGHRYKGNRVYKSISGEYAYEIDGEFLVELSEEEFKKAKGDKK